MPARKVPATEVQAYYAEWELRKPEYTGAEWPRFDQVQALSPGPLSDLVQRIATFRNNEMYRLTVAPNLRWFDTAVPTSSLVILGVNPKVNSAIQRAEYRLEEIARLHREDQGPDGIALRNEFKPFEGSPDSSRLICAEWAVGLVRIADGIHRAVGLASNGKPSFDVYLGQEQP